MAVPLMLKIDVDDKGSVKIQKVNNSLEEFDRKTNKASASAKNFHHTMGVANTIIGGTTKLLFNLKTAIAALGLGMIAKNAINVASNFEQMRIALDTITKGKGDETFEKLNKWALVMPINTEKAVDSYIRLRAMGLEPTIKQMTILSDTTVAFGGSTEKFESLAMALGKIQAKGKASARDLIQMATVGVPVIEILRQELNDTTISLENMMRKSYTSGQIINALFRGMEKRYGGLSMKIHNIWVGLIETLVSEWKELVRVVMESGVMTYLEKNLKKLTLIIEEWRESGKEREFARNVADIMIKTFEGIKNGIIYVIDKFREWHKYFGYIIEATKIFIAFKLTAILFEISAAALKTATAYKEMYAALKAINTLGKLGKISGAGQAGLIGAALYGGVEAGIWLRKNVDFFNQLGLAIALGFSKIFLKLKLDAQIIWEDLKYLFDKTLESIETALNFYIKMINKLSFPISQFINWILDSLNSLIEKLRNIPGVKNILGDFKFGHVATDMFKMDTIRLKEHYSTQTEWLGNIIQLQDEYNKTLEETSEAYFKLQLADKKLYDQIKEEKKYRVSEVPKKLMPTMMYGTGFAGYDIESKEKNNIIDYSEALMNIWKKIIQDFQDTFVEGFTKMLDGSIKTFKDFADQLKNIFVSGLAKMFSESLMRPFVKVIGGFLEDAIGGTLVKALGGKTGEGIGAALISKFGGGIGGAATFGILGAMGGTILSKIFGGKKTPSIDLKFTVDSEGFEQTLDKWSHTQKDQGAINAITDNIKALSNTYTKISHVLSTDMARVELTFKNIANLQADINNMGSQFAVANWNLLQQLFGSKLPTDIKNQITSLEQQLQELQSRRFPSPGLFFKKEQIKDQLDELYSSLNGEINILLDQFNSFFESMADMIGNSFSKALETNSFADFVQGFKQALFDSFKETLLNKTLQGILDKVVAQLWNIWTGGKGADAWVQNIVNDILAGKTTYIGEFSKERMDARFELMTDVIAGLEPIFNTFNSAIGNMASAIGVNTIATEANTDILEKQQQIQDFINELITGNLAPTQSVEAMTNRYSELLQGNDLNSLFSFVSGTMLPFLQSYGGNYQEIFGGLIQDLQSLSGNISEGNNQQIAPQSTAVEKAIYITLNIDGKQIGDVLIDQLNSNPQVVQAVKSV